MVDEKQCAASFNNGEEYIIYGTCVERVVLPSNRDTLQLIQPGDLSVHSACLLTSRCRVQDVSAGPSLGPDDWRGADFVLD